MATRDEGKPLGTYIINYGTFQILGSNSERVKTQNGPKALNKSIGIGKDKISIEVPAGATEGTIKVAGEIKIPEVVDTKKVTLEETQVSTIGMYINTSGTKFTKPITGLKCLESNKES